VKRWAERAGLPATDEPHAVLARLRQGLGAVLDARARQRELAQQDARAALQEDEARARLARATEEVAAIARPLGLAGAEGMDAPAIAALAEQRGREFERLTALETDILPAAEARLLPEAARTAQLAEIAQLELDGAAATPATATAADPAAIEQELAQVRKERLDLAGRVGGRDRDASSRIAQLMSERETFGAALDRARRFQAAVLLARDRMQTVARETHARWSENIAGRVDELLTRFGLSHQSFKLSDKLEASLTVGASG